MSPETARWLLSAAAAEVLAEHAGAKATPAVLTALRQRTGDNERAAAVLELADLRRRATAKFALAERMFFTRKAFEQATDQAIAAHKANRFAPDSRVIDACCGVGGDLIALAKRANAIGIDADPALAAFATRNVELHGSETSVRAERLTAEHFPDGDAWHADPDRRPGGRRTSQPDAYEPSLDTLRAWRDQTPTAAIKLAPAARLPEDWEADCELEWISRGGECRQLVAWCGPLAQHVGSRRATRIDPEGTPVTLAGLPGLEYAFAGELGSWIHEPDPAVLAADLVGTVCQHHGLAAATPKVPYLTSNTPVDDPLVASFEVLETLSLSRKRLAGWLAERGIGRLEIKCRGVDLRPEDLRRDLKPKGQGEATLLIYPDRTGKRRVVIAKRHQ